MDQVNRRTFLEGTLAVSAGLGAVNAGRSAIGSELIARSGSGSYIERLDGNRLVLFRRDGQRSSQPLTVEVSGHGWTGMHI